MTTPSLSVRPCPKMRAKRSASSLFTPISQTTRRYWPYWWGQEPLQSFTLRCKAHFPRFVRVLVQPGIRLQPWNDTSFRYAYCQTSACHGRPRTGYIRWWKSSARQFQLNFLDGWLWQAMADILRKTDKNPSNSGQICRYLIMRQNSSSIRKAGATKLRKFQNRSSTLARRDSTLVDMMKAQVNSAEPFDIKYCIKFYDLSIKDIVYGTLSF